MGRGSLAGVNERVNPLHAKLGASESEQRLGGQGKAQSGNERVQLHGSLISVERKEIRQRRGWKVVHRLGEILEGESQMRAAKRKSHGFDLLGTTPTSMFSSSTYGGGPELRDSARAARPQTILRERWIHQ